MFTAFLGMLGGGGGGTSTSAGPTSSGMNDFSGGNFGAVSFGSPSSGVGIDQESMIIIGVVAVVLFVVMKKGK